MKTKIKHILYNAGLFHSLHLILQLPKILNWIKNGCTGPAPPPIKRMVITSYLRRYGIRRFVETGTYLGDTLAYISQFEGIYATSIELQNAYFCEAENRFAKHKNINLLRGDSGKILPKIVLEIKEPTLFWLDGHYSGGNTGKGNLNTPVSAELDSILNSPIKGHVVLIDDARCFNGTHDYPHIDQLIESVRCKNTYHLEVSIDIIRLTPT